MMIVNEQLLEKTKETASAAQEGVDWLKMPANVDRIGEAARSIERELKRGVVDALRLSEAATRPMAVAVFGASQVGKSHLISVLARSNDELYAVFDGVDEPISYIKQINIDKEGESTGLVTRFTINKETTPVGFPVCLRWLSHADLIKIIANAYFFDGRPNSFPESGEIAEHVSGFSSASSGGQNNGLKPEDVWDLQEYFTQYMSASALTAKLDAFWMAAADICPNLSIADLGQFFSILWGKEEPITKLYVDLVTALQRLDFPKTAYVPLAAIDATNPEITSIITVAGLSDISKGSSEQIEVKTLSGASASLPRSSVAALTAEILITIQDKPWDFFDHTDLLDFPGYRSRGLKAADFEEDDDDSNLKGIVKYLAQNPDKTLQTLLLRGKVEYLFQRYVAEQEITSMLLCAQPNNLDVDQLPQVVAKWITATHGPKPEDRLNKEVLLFFIFTKFDLHFTRKTSDSSFGLEGRLGGAVENPLIQSYGGSADTWVKNWTPGEPFKNCYLMRNPNILNREIFDIDGQSEIGVRESEKGFLDDLKNTFVSVEPVQEHFSNPAEAFEQMMELNDGGASHIARNLSPVCNPKIKERQIQDRLKKLRLRLSERLSAYYVSSDSSVRLDERLAVADQVLQELYICDERMRFGSLLRGLMLDPGVLASRLHEASLSRAIETRTDDGTEASQAVASVAPSRPRPGAGRVRPRPTPGGGGAPASAPAGAGSEAKIIGTPSKAPTKNRQRLLAEAAIVTMIENLFEQADNPSLSTLTGVSAEALREIAKEIALAVRRVKLTDRLAEQIASIAFVDRRDELLNKATLAAEHVTNGFIADLGMSLLSEEKRAVIEYETGSQPVFKARAVAFDTSGITNEPDAFTTRYVDSWLHAFFKVVQDNALGGTLDVDPELNARLGGILERLSK